MDWGKWNERLKAKKKQSDKTDADLAAAVFKKDGVEDESKGRAAVNHWLNKRRPITLEAFFTICEELGADPGEILFEMPVIPKMKGNNPEMANALQSKGVSFAPHEPPPKVRRFKASRSRLRTK